MDLGDLGWNDDLERLFRPHHARGRIPARVVRPSRGASLVATAHGERPARISGRLRIRAPDAAELPVVGDWAAGRDAGPGEPLVLEALLPRRTRLVRKQPGRRSAPQVLAAHVDVVFLVIGPDRDFRLRRIERGLVLARESGARPVVVLSKADLRPDPDLHVRQAEAVASDVPVLAVSARSGAGFADVRARLGRGRTGVLVGSSGVGKSTLVNRLLGRDRQPTAAIRSRDGRGRHTTTHRELVRLPGSAGLLVDTPGLRELGLWADVDALATAFEEIETLAGGCRFRDCRHSGEPGCAVQRALGEGGLEVDRFESYLDQRRELSDLSDRRRARARRDDRRRRMAHETRNRKTRR